MPGQPVGERAGRRDQCVHHPQALGGFGDARGQLGVLHRPRRLGLEHLAAADAEQRQDGHRQHDQRPCRPASSAGAPEVDRGRQLVEAGQHGRARRGQAGHGLEIGVGERQVRESPSAAAAWRRPRRRTRSSTTSRMPSRGCQLAPVVAACVSHIVQPAAKVDGHRQHESRRGAVAVDQRHSQRAADGESSSPCDAARGCGNTVSSRRIRRSPR